VPITKPGKENSMEVTKFRPISLTNMAGKVMEKLLTNRITHFVYRNELLNCNQYGFTPQKRRNRRCHRSQGLLRRGAKRRANSNNSNPSRTRSV